MKNMNHLNKVLLMSLVALTVPSATLWTSKAHAMAEEVVSPGRFASALNFVRTAKTNSGNYIANAGSYLRNAGSSIANAASSVRNTRGVKFACDFACDKVVAHPRIATAATAAAAALTFWGAKKLYRRYWKSPVVSCAPGYNLLADVSGKDSSN